MKVTSLIAAFAALGVTAAAEAAPFTVSTGSAAWTVRQTAGASNNGAALNSITTANVLTGSLPNPWVAAPAGSAWIGQRANDGQFQTGSNSECATDGTYVYSLTWNGGVGGGTVSFSFAGDNTVSSLTVVQGATTLYNFTSSSISDFASLISTGVLNFGALTDVVVTATIVNAPGGNQTRNPSGFLVSGAGNTIDANAVPLPAAAALLPLGLAFFGAASRRKKSV